MRLWKLLAALLILVIVSAGCSNEEDDPAYREEVTIFGYLFIDEAITPENAIYIGKTMPLDEEYSAYGSALSGLTVTLQQMDTGSSYTLTEALDRPGFYSNSSVVIRERTTYQLALTYNGRLVTAQTTTPWPIEMVQEPAEMPDSLVYDDIPVTNPAVFRCVDPTEEQVCYVDVYCLEEWEDARYIHPFLGQEYPNDEEEYESGPDGEPRHIYGYLRLKNFDQQGDNYLFDWYGGMFWFYGRYQLGFYSLDDNYYNYLYREHPELSGGVENGIGVFGSADREIYFVKVVEE